LKGKKMPVPKTLTPILAKRKFEKRQELRAMAKDMGISVHKLALELSIDREIGLANKEFTRNLPAEMQWDESNDSRGRKVAKRQLRRENPELVKAQRIDREQLPEWNAVIRDAIRNDASVKMARKIFRAIPRESSAIVITRPEWEIVRIARPEKALNKAAIERQLRKAEMLAHSAIEKASEAKKLADAKTVLKRTPKALKVNAERLAGLADVELAKVRKVQHQLRKAELQKVADNKVIVPVKDIRISLRPQSMANSVARALLEIPERQDVHPFTEFVRIRDHRQFSPHSYESQPERDYRRYVEMMERIAELESEKEIRAERRERYFREQAEKAMAEFWAQKEQQERERKEKAKQRMANNRANWSPERKAIERMNNKESQRRAKIRNSKAPKGKGK
jgi:hypothetical protein